MSFRKCKCVFASALFAASAAACSSDNTVGPALSIDPPTLVRADIPVENALSMRVVFAAPDADSVRVAYQAAGGPVRYTPFVASGASDTIVVLGLKPTTSYLYQINARAGGADQLSETGTFTSGALPGPLANVALEQVSGATSYYAGTGVNTGAGGYAVIFDSTGAIVWYHDFTAAKLGVSNVLMQPNGDITAFVGNTSGWDMEPGYYEELTPDGREVETYDAPDTTAMDNHELVITGSGASKEASFFTMTSHQADLSAAGSYPSITATGHQIVRENASGGVEFNWNAWDHIAFNEWVGDTAAKVSRTTVTDFDHPNAIAFDANGNYVISWRNLDQVMGIDSHSGDILWRLGGLNGQYTFVNDPLGGFYKQHSVKVLGNGDILLFDNGTGHVPAESRAVEYRLDPVAKTATMVWQYRHNPPLFAPVVGWVERLANGDTWVAFSYFSRVVQVDARDNVQWEAQLVVNGIEPASYRIVPIASLYGYVKP